jgi:antitoxin Phd
MIDLSAAEAKQNFTEFLDIAQKEPITIQRQDEDLVVVLSVLEYKILIRLLKDEFQQYFSAPLCLCVRLTQPHQTK